MVDSFKLLDVGKFVEPCGSAKAQLDAAGPARMFSIANLKNIPGRCTWCESVLTGLRRRWCGNDCLQSALDYCYPQNPQAKMRRLIFKQGCACLVCGVIFEDEIIGLIQDAFEQRNRYNKTDEKPHLVSLHALGANTGHIWQTDHIDPIFRGGRGIDPDNLQTICTDCHDRKTVEERRK